MGLRPQAVSRISFCLMRYLTDIAKAALNLPRLQKLFGHAHKKWGTSASRSLHRLARNSPAHMVQL